MGKHKTQRTEQLKQAARRYVVGKQAEQAIEQHNFDKLVKQGVLVRDEQVDREFKGAEEERDSFFRRGAGAGKYPLEATNSTCQSVKYQLWQIP